jgi:hypothetical protein
MFGFGKKKSQPVPVSPIPGWVSQAITGSAAEREAACASLRAQDPSTVRFFLFRFLVKPTHARDAWELAHQLSAGDPFAFMLPEFQKLGGGERYELAKRLGESGSQAVTPALLLLLKVPEQHGELGCRQTAVWAFAKTKDPAAVPDLRKLLRDRDCNVTIGALGALLATEPSSATAMLCEVLADPTFDSGVRRYAAEKLRDVERTPRVLQVLEAAAQDPNENVSKAASLTLGRPKPDSFFQDLPRAIDIRRRDWVGLPTHVNPATCSDSAFIPVPPGTYGLVRVEYVQGQPWLILAQGSFQYQIDGGDFRVYWPNV